MRIGIDISQVIYGTGVSVYTRNLVKNLLAIDKKNEYVLFGGTLRRKKDLTKFVDGLEGNFTSRIFPIPPTLSDILWNRLCTLKIERLIGKVDVFHSSDWAEPPSDSFKVTTVHDLTPLKFPQLTPKKIIEVHKRKLERVKDVVDTVIVPSESTKKDLVTLGVSEGKIKVIPEAAADVFRPAKKKEIERVKKEYKISGGYLITVGTKPRKNLESTIKAFERVRAGQDLKLVVVGASKEREERGIRYVGHVSDEKLSVLYSGAEALVYPSFYEGFGLPVLEAFSCGCPVVASNTSSLPEIAGKAAILVDSYDLESIVDGIEKALKRKKSLRKKGLKQAKKFSWRKTAEKTLKVYSTNAR